MDSSTDGMLTLPEFRSVLKLCNGTFFFHILQKMLFVVHATVCNKAWKQTNNMFWQQHAFHPLV